ncbi:MAG: translation initiation factor 2 [Actinomycetales bacterium]|nr:translation initiation factor 2 [Actinomycetales bacterium]
MTTQEQTQAGKKYVEAKAAAAKLARKQGSPEYDPRAHRAAVERERRAAEGLDARD